MKNNVSDNEKENILPREKELSGKTKLTRKLSGTKGKLIMICSAVVLILVLVIILVVALTGSKGEKTAEKLSGYIGSTVEKAQQKTGISLKEKSAYPVLNNSVSFNRIYEPSGNLKSEGINYPDWAVFITEENGKISSVKFSDFGIIKSNINGKERKSVVNLDKYEKGSSFGTISDEIDIPYYSITYTDDGTEYMYRYRYITENEDEQPVILKVKFDKENKYVSYDSKLVYPENL